MTLDRRERHRRGLTYVDTKDENKPETKGKVPVICMKEFLSIK
jgi:hypothetical protein